ncbi:MAG: 30S ribosomal protein S4 [bacterium]|nr:30S ribosomal protein S4 [bacterium]
MAKRPQAKHKIDRRLGVNLWGRAKSPYNKREYGPGQHGQNRKKPTDYAIQLLAKQKLRGYYANIGEGQFYRLYEEARRRKGDSGHNLVELLERRIDTVMYRMKFVPTMFAARQFVNHGHVKVNGKRVTIPSLSLKDGDVIEVKEKSLQLALVVLAVDAPDREVPGYLEVNHKQGSGKFVRGPKFEEVPYPVRMEPNLIIEFYSR